MTHRSGLALPVAPRCACISGVDLRGPGHDRFEGPTKRAIETGRNRLLIAGALFILGFSTVAARLVDLSLLSQGAEPRLAQSRKPLSRSTERADIVDRNGVILATNLPTASLSADPRAIRNPRRVAARLAAVLPGLDAAKTERRLRSRRRFVWLQRNLTPRQQIVVNRLGVPGLQFQRGERRVYPNGRMASHVLGFTDIDNTGLAGVERFFDKRLRAGDDATGPLRLSLDIRVQYVLEAELARVVREQKALGASGLVLDVNSGEVLAMASLPDFDPDRPAAAKPGARFNRNTLGVYELGSTLKVFTTAMALEYGTATINDRYDVRPIRVARFTIRDHGRRRGPLSVSDIFTYSSNIGSARLALEVGGARQRTFLRQLGLFDRPAIELSEVGTPLRPKVWRPINTMTVAFGHGIAISPLQLAVGVAAVVDGGVLRKPTLLKRRTGDVAAGKRVISPRTSETMRRLMRRVVLKGTGRQAKAPGYFIGGKTGTAEKAGRGGYRDDSQLSSFVAAFPIDRPRYVVLVVVDSPKGVDGSGRRATGGWVAAPVVSRVVSRSALMLGIAPRKTDTAPFEEPRAPQGPRLPVVRVGTGVQELASN